MKCRIYPKEEIKTKWLVFGLLFTPSIKTQVWRIFSIKGIPLGFIKWFSRWRCYAFFPENETIFNSECLKDIKEFIDNLIKEHNTNYQI